MPRLHVWAAIGGGLASLGYAFDRYYYTPTLTTKREMELFVEAEKTALLNVFQALSILRDSAPVKNAERIATFCKIQLVRNDAFALAQHLQSAIDKSILMGALDELQQKHCVSLRCRDEPLTTEERWKCVAAFGLFVFAFRFVFPLLVVFRCVSEQSIVRGAVEVGSAILDLLEIDVDMSVDENVVSSPGSSSSPSILWQPSSWVEEAAFWASPSNPWTSLGDGKGHMGDGKGRIDVFPLLALDKRPLVERFEHRFQQVYQTLVDTANIAENGSRQHSVSMPPSQFGYPVSLRDVTLPPSANSNGSSYPSYIPVASIGIEKLTYLGADLATSDIRTPKSSTERYVEVMDLQYGSGNTLRNRKEPVTSRTQAAQRDLGEPAQLPVPAPLVELPLFSKESLTCIYGGRPRGSGRRRSIFLHVGAPAPRPSAWTSWVRCYADLADRVASVSV